MSGNGKNEVYILEYPKKERIRARNRPTPGAGSETPPHLCARLSDSGAAP